MLYFENRQQAGVELAKRLDPKYGNHNTAVLALSEGGLQVGSEIAQTLHCSINILLTEPIHIPGEPEPVGMLDQDGRFTYNSMYPVGHIEYFQAEYNNHIEEAKLEKRSLLHRMLGKGGFVDPRLLSNHIVIIVTDGLPTAASLDPVVSFLKPISIAATVAAVPVASVPAIDRTHVLVDDIECLNVTPNFMGTDHYYTQDTKFSSEQITKLIDNISLYWK